MIKFFLIFCFIFLFSACSKPLGDSELSRNPIENLTIYDVQLIETGELLLHGKGLNDVDRVDINLPSGLLGLEIRKKTDSRIYLRSTKGLSFLISQTFDLVVFSAQAEVVVPVVVTLPDLSVDLRKLSPSGAHPGNILKFDGENWVPGSLDVVKYKGLWNANINKPDLLLTQGFEIGDYFIVSTSGVFQSKNFRIGDWVIFNGSSWEKLSISTGVVNSFQGRLGDVTLRPDDYTSLKDSSTQKIPNSSLNDLLDVDFFVLPEEGNILRFTNGKWKPSSIQDGPSSPSGGIVTVSADPPLTVSDPTTSPRVSLPEASAQKAGFLSAADWNKFDKKESAISLGNVNQFFRGDKTWSDFQSSVLESILSDFVSLPASSLEASDSILSAFGKIQGQINQKADLTNSTQVLTASTLTGLILPISSSDAANKQYVDQQLSNISQVWSKSGNDAFYDSGAVSINFPQPVAKLHVGGQIVSAVFNNGNNTTFDMNNGNAQFTTASCGNMTLKNLVDGGSYTVAIQGTASGVCVFSDFNGLRQFRYSPTNASTTGGTHTIYSFQVMGNIVYVSWVTGF